MENKSRHPAAQGPNKLRAKHHHTPLLKKLFGTQRCCFASNFPVDGANGWSIGRLLKAFYTLATDVLQCDAAQLEDLFSKTAGRVYHGHLEQFFAEKQTRKVPAKTRTTPAIGDVCLGLAPLGKFEWYIE